MLNGDPTGINQAEASVEERRGELWPMDRFGRILNAGDRQAMTPLARRVARAVGEAFRARLRDDLHSVYLTGPAARGRPGPIEAVGVLRKTAACTAVTAMEEAAGAIRARWPGAGRPELSVHDWSAVFPEDESFSLTRFRIAVTSVCLTGRDLTRAMAPQRLSAAASNAWIVRARDELDAISDRLSLAAREEDVRREAQRAGRFLLEAGFALVMPAEGVYSEDPDLQRDFFALNHPERAGEAERAYALASSPTEKAGELMAFLDTYGRWFASECERWLDRYNPQRLVALPA